MNYRKKAVVIEAFKWTGGPDQIDDPVWICEAIKKGNVWFEHNPFCIKIKTLEGTMTGSVGDFIIQGVKGEIYPCKPDIFALTYEAVEELPESKPEPKNDCEQGYTPGSVCKFCPTKGCKARRYCSKEVPGFEKAVQSEPEKNCGNCDNDRTKCTEHEQKYGCDGWQPKPQEPQWWEDGFIKKWGFLQNLSVGFSEMLNDIRQVAAEEREKGYKDGFTTAKGICQSSGKEAISPWPRPTHAEECKKFFENIVKEVLSDYKHRGEK